MTSLPATASRTRRRSRRRGGHVRLRATLAGFLFVGVAMLLGVAAVKSQVAMMFVLFGAMMGAVYVSAVAARRMLRSVDVRREVPARAWQGRTVHLGYFVRNTRKRGVCLGLSVAERQAEGIDSADGYCVHLPAQAVFRAGGRFVARHRGRILLRDIELATLFPFGLLSASRRIRQEAAVVIWPARGVLKTQLLRRGAVETSSAAPSQATGGQDEFFGLREYRSGDNPRWIHWRRSATKPVPVLREMARPLPEVLWVVVDTYLRDRSELSQAARERLLRFAATLIDHALARGYQVALALAFADGPKVFAPAEGKGHRCTLLDALADVDDNTGVEIERTAGALHRRQLAQAQVVAVLGNVGPSAAASVAALGRACRHLTVIHEGNLSAVFDDTPPAGDDGDDSPPAEVSWREGGSCR